MKRLLAYLFIVLGLGLVVNVNAEARILEVCNDGINGYNGKLYIKNHFSKKSLNKQKTGLLGSQYYKCESHFYSDNKKLYNAVYKGMGWHHSVNQGYKWNGIIYGENYLVILRSFDIKSNIYPSEKKQTQIAKVEPSQTQKILKSDKTLVNLVFCHEDFVSSFSTVAKKTKLRLDNCKKKEYQVNWVDFIDNWKIICYNKSDNPVLKFFQIVGDNCNKFNENIVTIKHDGESFYYGKGKVLNYVSNPNIVKSKTQIAKAEPTVKPKKTNKQSKTKITKKIIKTDAQDPKVKDISTWEKNVLAAIEKEKNDPYCKLVDKKPTLDELLTKKKSGADFKLNLCIKKSDVLKLGEYKKFNAPKFILDEIKGCKSNICIGNKSGKNVFKIFVQRTPVYHANHPGDMIKGMAWFEILYQTKLKKLQKTLKRYDEQKYEGLMKLKKKDHEREIYSLIKLNNGRIKMRKALGFTLYDDMYDVIEGQWLLAEFLNKDKLKVSKVKMTPEMFKRKQLIEKYKTVLAKYKKKLDEEKDKKIN
jgi:hypothetical protein